MKYLFEVFYSLIFTRNKRDCLLILSFVINGMDQSYLSSCRLRSNPFRQQKMRFIKLPLRIRAPLWYIVLKKC